MCDCVYLPPHVWERIIGYVSDQEDLRMLRYVCTHFKSHIKNPPTHGSFVAKSIMSFVKQNKKSVPYFTSYTSRGSRKQLRVEVDWDNRVHDPELLQSKKLMFWDGLRLLGIVRYSGKESTFFAGVTLGTLLPKPRFRKWVNALCNDKTTAYPGHPDYFK